MSFISGDFGGTKRRAQRNVVRLAMAHPGLTVTIGGREIYYFVPPTGDAYFFDRGEAKPLGGTLRNSTHCFLRQAAEARRAGDIEKYRAVWLLLRALRVAKETYGVVFS